MVIVIISSGIENKLIVVNIIPTAMQGINITTDAVKNDLNRTNSIKKIAIKTNDKVLIWELNKLCNKLL
jgi:hypothetical protein